MPSATVAGLPEWVWEMLRTIYSYEQEHPTLYRQAIASGKFEQTGCSGAWEHVPVDVAGQVAVLDEYLRRQEAKAEVDEP